MDYKAVLFDLDGTLLDTLQDRPLRATASLAVLGCPSIRLTPIAILSATASMSWPNEFCRSRCALRKPLRPQRQPFKPEYTNNWNDRSAPYAGIPAMLDQLIAAGLRLCILSNKPDAFTRLCVEQLLPHWSFDPLGTTVRRAEEA